MTSPATPATSGRRTFPAGATVTVEAGGQRIVLVGREAAMVAELALAWQQVAAVSFGTVCFDVNPARAQLRVERRSPPICIE